MPAGNFTGCGGPHLEVCDQVALLKRRAAVILPRPRGAGFVGADGDSPGDPLDTRRDLRCPPGLFLPAPRPNP